MRKTDFLKSSAGVSILEVMVAMTVIGITFYSLVTVFSNYAALIARVDDDKAQYLSIANFRESVLANPAQYQMAANQYEGEALLAADRLPWFLNKNQIVSAAECTARNNCGTYEIRVGYVMYPQESGVSRNIYTLKIRMYDVKNQYSKDFAYLVSPK